ncbi:MAG: hypothetical protein M0Z58_04545 [Nitrospiraceae bacterium]|nr:hypothetical protein [Nitrospiraceae bacterium]
MDISSALTTNASTSTSTGQSSSSGLPSASSLQNEFLQLLTAQLQYQDPLQPIDNTQFAAQLAQFSQLDQLSSLNSEVAGLSNNMASSLIGKYVGTAASNGLTEVTGVSLANGQTSLLLADNTSVNMSDVTEITNSK